MKKLIFSVLLLSLARMHAQTTNCLEQCWEQFGFGFDNLECQLKCPELRQPIDVEIVDE